jgi:hypothetical protein
LLSAFTSAVFSASLLQDFDDFWQQDLPFAHFFFLPLSVLAKETPLTNKAAVANKNNFFILKCLID